MAVTNLSAAAPAAGLTAQEECGNEGTQHLSSKYHSLHRLSSLIHDSILIIGAKNCGKTSFLNLLRSSLTPGPGKSSPDPGDNAQYESSSVSSRTFLRFSSHYLETKIDNEHFGVTIWDSEGLIPSMIDLQLRDIVTFLESKFEETYDEEVKLARDPGARDTRVHCVFLLLDPVRIGLKMATSRGAMAKEEDFLNGAALARANVTGGLDDKFDLQALRMLCEKTTVIPVVSKADTVTLAHMSYLKRAVWESIKANALDPFDIIIGNSPESSQLSLSSGNPESRYSDDDEMATKAEKEKQSSSKANDKKPSTIYTPAEAGNLSHRIHDPTNHMTPILPLSIISPDTTYDQGFPGRKFPWGAAQTDNPLHCDFSKLKQLIFIEWRDEMREASRVLWYERWRTARLDRWNTSRLEIGRRPGRGLPRVFGELCIAEKMEE